MGVLLAQSGIDLPVAGSQVAGFDLCIIVVYLVGVLWIGVLCTRLCGGVAWISDARYGLGIPLLLQGAGRRGCDAGMGRSHHPRERCLRVFGTWNR